MTLAEPQLAPENAVLGNRWAQEGSRLESRAVTRIGADQRNEPSVASLRAPLQEVHAVLLSPG
jgi:hypothetical protein